MIVINNYYYVYVYECKEDKCKTINEQYKNCMTIHSKNKLMCYDFYKTTESCDKIIERVKKHLV